MRKSFKTFALLGAASSIACACPAMAEDDVSIGEDGIELALGDDAVTIELGGKAQFDAFTYDNAGISATSGDFRRIRPDLRVKIADIVTMRAEWEFSGSKGWRNLYAQIEPIDGLTLRGGNFIVPFGMEDIQGSAVLPFAERSLASAITPGFGLGGQLGYASRQFTAKIAYVDDALDSEEGRAPEHGKGVTGRLTWLPVDGKNTKLHLGFGAEKRTFDAVESLRYTATAGTTFSPDLLRTERLSDLSSLTAINAEVGLIHSSLALQGQYVHQSVRRDTLADASLSGGYVQASWMATGEDYRYSRGSGAISGPRLKSSAMPAVELAARFSWLDAGDPVLGGRTAEAVDLSAGLHLTTFARVSLNGTKAWHEDETGTQTDFSALILRFQLDF